MTPTERAKLHRARKLAGPFGEGMTRAGARAKVARYRRSRPARWAMWSGCGNSTFIGSLLIAASLQLDGVGVTTTRREG